MQVIVEKMGEVFCNLINHCSNDLSTTDVENILPILHFLEVEKNYEASFLLANYFDPDGCIFNPEKERDSKQNYESAMIHYAKTVQLTQNLNSDRERALFELCSEILRAYENANGKKV